MDELVRHRQTKGSATDRLFLNHRATSRLYRSVIRAKEHIPSLFLSGVTWTVRRADLSFKERLHAIDSSSARSAGLQRIRAWWGRLSAAAPNERTNPDVDRPDQALEVSCATAAISMSSRSLRGPGDESSNAQRYSPILSRRKPDSELRPLSLERPRYGVRHSLAPLEWWLPPRITRSGPDTGPWGSVTVPPG